MRKDYFGLYDPSSPGHMGYNWRQVCAWCCMSVCMYTRRACTCMSVYTWCACTCVSVWVHGACTCTSIWRACTCMHVPMALVHTWVHVHMVCVHNVVFIHLFLWVVIHALLVFINENMCICISLGGWCIYSMYTHSLHSCMYTCAVCTYMRSCNTCTWLKVWWRGFIYIYM